jgi:hypothetical protein
MTRLDFLWLLVVGVASSAWCLTAGRELGATFDEPFYVAKGLEAWRTGSHRALMRAGTMPMPVDVQTLPLHVWERVRGEPFDPVSDLPKLLPVARGMNLVFWWPLLVYVGLLGRLWGGAWAGRLAVGLVGCEPNLLAHASLATTDIALTAGVLAAVYHFAVGRGGTWRKRVLIPGVAAGLAVACKASAITFVPLGWLVLAPPRSRSGFADWLLIALVAAVVLFAYCGSDWAVEPSFVKWADALPDGSVADAMRFTADHLRIFPNAGEGIVQQIKHNMRGHGSYALGEYHPRAVWYYFPVVLSEKLPEPLLLTLAGLLIMWPRTLLNPAGRIAAAYLLFSLTCRVQIGIRLVFPLVVMLNVAAAVALSHALHVGSRLTRVIVAVVLLVSLLLALIAWPHGLRHLNRFWGGPNRAPEILTDSNYDWGQGLPELARWHTAAGEPTLHVWYYGTDPAILLPPFHVFQVNQLPEPSVDVVKQRAGGGCFAVGASLLTACPDRRPGTLAVIGWLKSLRPVARVGTFVVYRLD